MTTRNDRRANVVSTLYVENEKLRAERDASLVLISRWRKLAKDLRSMTLVTQSAADQATRLEECAAELEEQIQWRQS